MAVSPTRAVLRRVWRRIEASPAQSLAWRVRRFPRSVRQAGARRLGAAALALGGPDSLGPLLGAGPDAGNRRSSWGRLPKTYAISPRPRDVASAWPAPPEVEEAGRVVRSIYDTGDRPPVMDLALLESLNEEYRSKPLVPAPQLLDQASREDRAKRRLLDVHHQIDLADKKVLELGCGPGFEVWYMSHQFGADAWGIDVVERAAWTHLVDERTHLVCADIARDQPFEPDSFDRIVTFSVFEHIVHPYGVLKELFRVLRPGGLAAISANLHRGPRASHLYRELYFPYPHLLFSDDVIREFRLKHHDRDGGASWVNRLTWSQYEDYFRQLGFVIHSLRFSEAEMDEPFYERFSNILGRYPRWDLTKDFFHVVVEKPRSIARPS